MCIIFQGGKRVKGTFLKHSLRNESHEAVDTQLSQYRHVGLNV